MSPEEVEYKRFSMPPPPAPSEGRDLGLIGISSLNKGREDSKSLTLEVALVGKETSVTIYCCLCYVLNNAESNTNSKMLMLTHKLRAQYQTCALYIGRRDAEQ